MADARSGPQVVHGPHHRLAAAHYLAYAVERQHALVNPVEVYHVSLLKLRQTGYVAARIGNVYLEQMLLLQVKTQEDG